MEPSTILADQIGSIKNKIDEGDEEKNEEKGAQKGADSNNNNVIASIVDGGINNNKTIMDDNEDDHETEDTQDMSHSKFDIDDHNATLLGNTDYSVYNECSVPFHNANKNSLFNKGKQLTSSLKNSTSAKPIPTAQGNNCEFTMIDLNNRSNSQNNLNESEEADYDEESGLAQPKFTNNTNTNNVNKMSVHGDMMQSINNLRLNVNNHIIGSSKNVMGKMRKLSISELNRHGKSGRKYKIAFYVTLISLSLLFLYLIYQNLFNTNE